MPVNLQKKWLTIAVNHLKIITKQIRLLCLCLCLIYRHLEAVTELFLSAVLFTKVNHSAELHNSLNDF